MICLRCQVVPFFGVLVLFQFAKFHCNHVRSLYLEQSKQLRSRYHLISSLFPSSGLIEDTSPVTPTTLCRDFPPSIVGFLSEQDIILHDYEIQDLDAWEGRGTPLQVSLGVTETNGTGPHRPTLSLSTVEGLSFTAPGEGDGVQDSSMTFIAGLEEANSALSSFTIHTTASERAVAASGVVTIRACDSGEWIDADRSSGRRGGWDWGDRCRDEGWAEKNISYSYRLGTSPILDRTWPVAAPMSGGLAVEVRQISETRWRY